MKKEQVIKSNYEFNNIINNRKYVKNQDFVIYYEVNDINKDKYGVSVGKKIGNAVTRNYYKRIIRSIITKNRKKYSNKLNYIIIIRNSCLKKNFNELEESLDKLLLNLNREK